MADVKSKWKPRGLSPAEAACSFVLHVSEAVNYAASSGFAAHRHQGGPSPRPLHSGTQRSERLCFTFTDTKECDCRLAQLQDARGKQKTIINLQLWTQCWIPSSDFFFPLSLVFFFFFEILCFNIYCLILGSFNSGDKAAAAQGFWCSRAASLQLVDCWGWLPTNSQFRDIHTYSSAPQRLEKG